MDTVPPALVSTDQAAQLLGVSPRRVRQWLAKGRIMGAQRVGRAWVIPTPIRLTPGARGPEGAAGPRPTASPKG